MTPASEDLQLDVRKTHISSWTVHCVTGTMRVRECKGVDAGQWKEGKIYGERGMG